MKKFFLKLAFLTLFITLGFLGWRNFELRWKLGDLRHEIAQLEQERRDLEQKVASAQRPAKPEEQAGERQRIEQQTSELRGLPFKTTVHYKMIERAELRRVLVEKIKEQYTEQELASEFGVSGYPTTLFFKADGTGITAVPGYADAAKFKTILTFIGDDHYLNTKFEDYAKTNK